jgi:hypothetical protein
MAISDHYSSLARPVIIITEYRFLIHSMQKGIRKLHKKFDRDPTVRSKVLPFRAVTLAWRDQTSSSLGIDSTSTPWERASGNSIKGFIAIQRSYQKLWPFRTVTQASRDHTSSSSNIDSSSTPCKRASGNSRKSLIGIQRSDQKFCPFELLL